MFSRFKLFILVLSIISAGTLATFAQETQPTPTETPTAAQKTKKTEDQKKEKEKDTKRQTGDLGKNATAEQIAETVIYLYGGGGGRANLKQIRRTTIEDGKLNIIDANGKNEQVNYERRVMRGDNLEQEKVRLDQEFPNAKYALIYNDKKIVGLYNEAVFAPREDAAKAFQNQIWHGLEALLRYKENGSTPQLVGRDKIMGVDLYVLNVTDKENRKTTFYISAKTYRVLWLEYTEDGVKYKRKFYDYRYAQGTLVPYRVVLLADDKQIEEANVSTSTFGQKIDEEIFKTN